ncbi:MAG TPA: hypothetical protein V6D29_20395 [Leptolyngbyaceae cyanobacterium]
MSEETIYTLGKTGDTVIHVFPNGQARMNRRAKTDAPHPSKTQHIEPEKAEFFKAHGADSIGHPKTNSKFPSKADDLTSHPKSVSTEDLGQSLIQAGVITQGQYQVACHDQTATGMSLMEALVARGWLDPQS